MKKIETIILNTVFAFLYVIAACVVSMVIEWGATFLIDKFVEMSYLVLTIVRAVIYTITVLVLISIFGYKEGYRVVYASVGENIPAMVVSGVVHLLLAILFNFSGFISGPVRFLCLLVKFGGGLSSSEQLQSVTRIEYVPVFVLFYLVCAIVMIAAKKIGATRRVINRAELRKNEKPDENANETPNQ